jgi:Zn-dependent protease with chaperone function
VTLLRKNVANAYCLPGGKIVVYSGIDPRQALAFWKRMLRASKGKEPPEFLSDHPSDAHRVERVQGWLPEAERAYKPQT